MYYENNYAELFSTAKALSLATVHTSASPFIDWFWVP